MCNGAPFTVEKILPGVGIELGPLDQCASAEPTELQELQNLMDDQLTNSSTLGSYAMLVIQTVPEILWMCRYEKI